MFSSVKAYYKNLVPQITSSEWEALEKCLIVRQLKKGEFLVRAGQICKYVSFINSGLVRLYYSIDGKDISIGFAQQGDYTSEYESFLTRKPAAQNIEALTDVEVIRPWLRRHATVVQIVSCVPGIWQKDFRNVIHHAQPAQYCFTGVNTRRTIHADDTNQCQPATAGTTIHARFLHRRYAGAS